MSPYYVMYEDGQKRTFMRHQGSPEAEYVLQKFGPKAEDHPGIGLICPGCQKPMAGGDYTTLIVIGPGDDPEAQERALNDRFYSAVCVEVHWACATGEVPVKVGSDGNEADESGDRNGV